MDSQAASGAKPIVAATQAYERWLGKHVVVVESDLKLKHQYMKDSLFVFLRATFYRWAALWQETCPDLAEAPRLLAGGDLLVKNFGTWRDPEGRLISLTISIKWPACPMRSISCAWSPAPYLPSERTTSPSTTATRRRRCWKAIPNILRLVASRSCWKRAILICG